MNIVLTHFAVKGKEVNGKNYHKDVSLHLYVIHASFFQSVLESLPGVDPQSDAVRQAVGAMSKSSTSKKDTDKKDDKDGKK